MLPSDIGLPALQFPSYRDGQFALSLRLSRREKRFTILQAPTGSGKSLIYITSAVLSGARVLILVKDKGLQSQLLNDFGCLGAVSLVGHSSYQCARVGTDDAGEFIGLDCTAKRMGVECLYFRDITQSLKHNIVITNYAHWITISRSVEPDRLGHFDLIVCDEAHEVDTILLDHISVRISPRSVMQLVSQRTPRLTDTPDTWREWASDVRPAIYSEHLRLKEAVKSAAANGRDSDHLRKQVARVGRLLENVTTISIDCKNGTWVVSANDRKSASGIIKLSPVWCGSTVEQYVFRGIDQVVLCSATVTLDDAKYLSIPVDDLDYVEVSSSFRANRRPFYHLPVAFIDHKILDGDLRKVVRMIDNVIQTRSSVRGLIHSRSYAHSRNIERLTKMGDITLFTNSNNSRQTINEFINSYNENNSHRVLVSPAIEQGYDFAGDRARWQVIFKVPFVDSREPLTAARKITIPSYTDTLAARSILQMAGRINRFDLDWGETLIFDKHWWHFSQRATFPKYFRDSWRFVRELPPPLKF